jgi:hypothetical protein
MVSSSQAANGEMERMAKAAAMGATKKRKPVREAPRHILSAC